jgi:hypothetical protein
MLKRRMKTRVSMPRDGTCEQHIGGAGTLGRTLIECIKVNKLVKAYKEDPWFKVPENIAPLLKSERLWWKVDKLVIPKDEKLRDKVLVQAHDSIYAGHPGRTKTYDLVSRSFWWPSMRTSVKVHCETCDSCQRVRQNNQKAAGLYQALPIPLLQWDSISMDLITQLPPTENGNTCIVVFVDKLTKMIHVIPTGPKYRDPPPCFFE